MLDERLEKVRFENARAVPVDDGRDALEAHSRVDAFALQRRPVAGRVPVPLHEDEVPDLEEPIAVLAVWPAVGPAAAVLLAPVVVDL